MEIYQRIYEKIILNMPECPPEIGGILGKDSENIICEAAIDEGIKKLDKRCSYIPNVKILNEKIRSWEKRNIDFAGIFHTHFWGVETLSDGDRQYITEIMLAMPHKINFLFFPIVVLPKRKMISFIAFKKDNNVVIRNEDIIVKNTYNVRKS